jgi:hypothetical protein
VSKVRNGPKAYFLLAGRAPNFISYLLSSSRSTKSLQLPSLSASSVMTTVPLGHEWSKAVAAAVLGAHRTLMPRASISFSMPGTGLVAHSTMIVFAASSACIVLSTLLQGSQSDLELL